MHEPLCVAIEPLQTSLKAIGQVDPDGYNLGTIQLSIGLEQDNVSIMHDST